MELVDLFSTENLVYIALVIVAAVVAFLLIKKVAGCVIKAVIFAVLVALLAFLYYTYSGMQEESHDDGEQTEMRE